MPEKATKLSNDILSIMKMIPLVAGATAGIWMPVKGGSSPLADLKRGDFQSTMWDLTDNYVFYDGNNGFSMDQGRGTKALVIGVAIHKIIGWLT
jgi:hypothetical protein